MGIQEADQEYTYTLNIFENHYFIEEKTPFSTYYIKHLSENLDIDKFNKEYESDHWINARYYISSSNLVRELFKQGFCYTYYFWAI